MQNRAMQIASDQISLNNSEDTGRAGNRGESRQEPPRLPFYSSSPSCVAKVGINTTHNDVHKCEQ